MRTMKFLVMMVKNLIIKARKIKDFIIEKVEAGIAIMICAGLE